MSETSFTRTSSVIQKDARQQVAWGVVLEPRTAADPDLQGDWYSGEQIAKAAHGFLAKLAGGRAGADLMHDGRRVGVIVESYIAPADMQLGDQFVPAGSWIAGVHYPDPDVWDLVEKGLLGAFSVGGHGRRIAGGP